MSNDDADALTTRNVHHCCKKRRAFVPTREDDNRPAKRPFLSPGVLLSDLPSEVVAIITSFVPLDIRTLVRTGDSKLIANLHNGGCSSILLAGHPEFFPPSLTRSFFGVMKVQLADIPMSDVVFKSLTCSNIARSLNSLVFDRFIPEFFSSVSSFKNLTRISATLDKNYCMLSFLTRLPKTISTLHVYERPWRKGRDKGRLTHDKDNDISLSLLAPRGILCPNLLDVILPVDILDCCCIGDVLAYFPDTLERLEIEARFILSSDRRLLSDDWIRLLPRSLQHLDVSLNDLEGVDFDDTMTLSIGDLPKCIKSVCLRDFQGGCLPPKWNTSSQVVELPSSLTSLSIVRGRSNEDPDGGINPIEWENVKMPSSLVTAIRTRSSLYVDDRAPLEESIRACSRLGAKFVEIDKSLPLVESLILLLPPEFEALSLKHKCTDQRWNPCPTAQSDLPFTILPSGLMQLVLRDIPMSADSWKLLPSTLIRLYVSHEHVHTWSNDICMTTKFPNLTTLSLNYSKRDLAPFAPISPPPKLASIILMGFKITEEGLRLFPTSVYSIMLDMCNVKIATIDGINLFYHGRRLSHTAFTWCHLAKEIYHICSDSKSRKSCTIEGDVSPVF